MLSIAGVATNTIRFIYISCTPYHRTALCKGRSFGRLLLHQSNTLAGRYRLLVRPAFLGIPRALRAQLLRFCSPMLILPSLSISEQTLVNPCLKSGRLIQKLSILVLSRTPRLLYVCKILQVLFGFELTCSPGLAARHLHLQVFMPHHKKIAVRRLFLKYDLIPTQLSCLLVSLLIP